MELPDSTKQNDSILLPLLQISEQELSPAVNEILVIHAEPIIQEILRNRMDRPSKLESSSKDIEDIHAEVILRLLTRLNSFRIHPEEKGIQDFAKYVAVVTHNSCNEYYREKYPERSRLKKRLRYLLGHDPMFAIWESIDAEWMCGFRKWREKKNPVRSEKFHQLQSNPQSWIESAKVEKGLAEFINRIFAFLGNPILLEDLVSLTAAVLKIHEKRSENNPYLLQQIPDPPIEKEFSIDRKAYLSRLWSEIQQLPPRQKKALLLNLRDNAGINVVSLFPHTGIATIRQIAETLEIPAHDFAMMWPSLPIEDERIADLLNVTRQQVINLRKCARERLARRMKTFDASG